MSGVIEFPKPTVHLWLHPTEGGWVGVIAGKVDPDWPHTKAEWIASTSDARRRAAELHESRGLPLHLHAGEF